MPGMKPVPRRPPEGSSIVVTNMEVMPDCAVDKVCADGTVENNGGKTAYLVRLKVELGGTKVGHPRTYFVQPLRDTEMEPGETQDFSLMIDRKFPYKDAQKKDKILEVGRYNFRVVPVWASAPGQSTKAANR
jgi:hypothetical protein